MPPTIENFACLSIPSGCGDEDGDGGSVANTGTEGETVGVVDDCGSEVVTTKWNKLNHLWENYGLQNVHAVTLDELVPMLDDCESV